LKIQSGTSLKNDLRVDILLRPCRLRLNCKLQRFQSLKKKNKQVVKILAGLKGEGAFSINADGSVATRRLSWISVMAATTPAQFAGSRSDGMMQAAYKI
jgi:hypothetical protein